MFCRMDRMEGMEGIRQLQDLRSIPLPPFLKKQTARVTLIGTEGARVSMRMLMEEKSQLQ